MTQNQKDPKGLKNTSRPNKTLESTNEDRSADSDQNLQEQVLNEEDQQNSVNPTDVEGDARGVFLDLHKNTGPGDDDDDDDDDDEDAGVSDPGTEIDIPFPDSDDDADDTKRKIPSF
jgi:hypothetical protein